jgi:REP element-mobilizing transposase RayT
MPDGRRWRNLGEANQMVFVTTTVQGFTPAFSDPAVADTMLAGMLADLKELEAGVYGFVVMPEHIHLLLKLPSGLSVSQLVNVIKSKSARRILPMLANDVRSKHESKRTLKDRVLWQRSFRSVIIDADWAFVQKIEYIHNNPVKRGFCSKASDYRWSSAVIYSDGLGREDGIDLDSRIQLFGDGTPPQGVAR